LGTYWIYLLAGFACLCMPGLDAESLKFSTALL